MHTVERRKTKDCGCGNGTRNGVCAVTQQLGGCSAKAAKETYVDAVCPKVPHPAS